MAAIPHQIMHTSASEKNWKSWISNFCWAAVFSWNVISHNKIVFIVDSTLQNTVGNVWIGWLIVSADDNKRSCDVRDQSGMKQAKTTTIQPNHLTVVQIWSLHWWWLTHCHRHPNSALLIVQTKMISAHSPFTSNTMKKWCLSQQGWQKWASHSRDTSAASKHQPTAAIRQTT